MRLDVSRSARSGMPANRNCCASPLIENHCSVLQATKSAKKTYTRRRSSSAPIRMTVRIVHAM